jgi:hypothetical protein
MAKKLKPTTRFKIWVEIERIETDAEGNETYHDEDFPESIAYRDNIEDAVHLQQVIANTFGELSKPAPLTKEVIGFQVVTDDNDMNIHPDMAGSFCVYSLKQARKMVAKGCQNKSQKWKLITIYSGDIEEPTMMFKDNPNK